MPDNVDQNTPETSQESGQNRQEPTSTGIVINEDGTFEVSSLPDPVQGYIKELRNESAGRRVASNELKKQLDDLQSQIKARENTELEATGQWKQLVENQQTQVQQLTEQLDMERLSNQRTIIGLQHGLDAAWLDRLHGNTPEELVADAQRLAGMLGKTVQQAPPAAPPEQPAATPPAGTPPPTTSPPAAPSGETPPDRDAYRKQVYFSQGQQSPMFDPSAGGGVQFVGGLSSGQETNQTD